MKLEEFQSLDTVQIANLVHSSGPKVCVFPINGTRRWFLLEYSPVGEDDFAARYLEAMISCYIQLYRLIFDHGLHTILSPAFGPDLMSRGDEYAQMAATGWVQMLNHPDFTQFFEIYQVAVHFYGDYRRVFAATPFAHLVDLFDELMEKTRRHDQHRLFFGLFAHDAAEAVANIAVQFYREHGAEPNKRQIVEAYYGVDVEPVDLFIGFDKFAAFDMPLVATGNEALYFTITPSPYLNQRQLRAILHDWMYARRDETDYSEATSEDWAWMRAFYDANRDNVQGIGMQRGGVWYPLPQVSLPAG